MQELLKRIRRIEYKTRRLTENVFAGEYHSAFKGRGMSFAEVREYQPGDNVRDIDWNVTARFGRPYVKVFEEERELTMMLLVDVSQSGIYGTRDASARELLTEMAATLAFSALQNKDKVGIIFFSDKVEGYIPPKKGRSHILLILRQLLTLKPAEGTRSNIVPALEFLMRTQRKRGIAVLLSDFLALPPYEHPLGIAAMKHDLVALRIADPTAQALPAAGLVKMRDAETGFERHVDLSARSVRDAIMMWNNVQRRAWKEMMNRHHVRAAEVVMGQDYVKPLRQLLTS